jgi:ADP-heptose:LPS heptosyltransferase
MGDVALTTPVLAGIREQYPDIELVLLTRQLYNPFFSSIEGLELFSPDLKSRHRGLPGLFRLYKDISRQGKIDYVIDIHDVLRSKIIRLLFRISGISVSVIDKGRGEKRSLTGGKNKKKLKHSVERYCDTFSRAGYPVSLGEGPWIVPTPEAITKTGAMVDTKGELNIGVAPYAKHKLKMWPEENMIRLLEIIAESNKVKFWLFGGMEDSEQIAAFQKKVPESENMVGQLNLDEELALMSQLDMMIAMDSSNMHMAALVGIKVISIWGGTDPLTGFGAWKQPENHAVRISVEELQCRPCTVYGKGECSRGDFACMNWLTPDLVFKSITKEGLFNDRES